MNKSSLEVDVFARLGHAIMDYVVLFTDDPDEQEAARQAALDAIIEATDHIGDNK